MKIHEQFHSHCLTKFGQTRHFFVTLFRRLRDKTSSVTLNVLTTSSTIVAMLHKNCWVIMSADARFYLRCFGL